MMILYLKKGLIPTFSKIHVVIVTLDLVWYGPMKSEKTIFRITL